VWIEYHVAESILDLWNCYSQSHLYIRFTHLYRFMKSILLWDGVVSSLFDCLGKCKNAWKLQIYNGLWKRQAPSKNIYVVFEIYIFSISFHKIFVVCEYQLWQLFWIHHLRRAYRWRFVSDLPLSSIVHISMII
jgi:hypothetical protein